MIQGEVIESAKGITVCPLKWTKVKVFVIRRKCYKRDRKVSKSQAIYGPML